jgi:mono/diheme cytochrome c family protein
MRRGPAGWCARSTMLAILIGCGVGVGVGVAATVADAQTNMGGHQPKSDGQRIYEKANCVGCHKWHGGGGGGYGGAALSLRDTQLDRDQIIEVVHCGRPGTGMPYHDRDAYKEYRCYDGLTVEDLGKDMPPEAATFLRPKEIEVVVDWVLANLKGKGQQSYADCANFFGTGARACDIYKNEGVATTPRETTPAGK